MSEMSYLEKLLDGVEVEWKTLGQTCKIETGKLNANAAVDDGEYMFFTTAKETSKIDKFRWDTEALLIAGNANVGEVKHYIGKFEAYQRTYVLTNFDENVSVRFLYFVLSHSLKKYLEERTNSAAMTYIVLSTLENFPIPIPCPGNPKKSLEIQAEIVRILDAFTELTAELTTELTARKKQYNYYRDQLLSFEEGDVEWKTLGEVATIGTGSHDTQDAIADGEYIFYARGREPLRLNEFDFDETAIITAGDGAGVGKVFHYAQGKYALHQRAYRIVPGKAINPRFVYHCLKSHFYAYIQKASVSSSVTSLRRPMFLDFPIPAPALIDQDRIAAILDKFDQLTDSLTAGLPREIELRQKQYEYYRNLLLSFPKPEAPTVAQA